MKLKLIVFSLFISLMAWGQSPSLFLKMTNDMTAFGQNIPKGTLLYDMVTFKRYVVLKPLDATKTINDCYKLLLDEVHVIYKDGTTTALTSTAEIKEIGTNSSNHYIGEIITTDDGASSADDGIVISIWTESGKEKVLLLALTNGSQGAWNGTTDARGWRLPTVFELNTIHNSATIVNSVLATTPNGPFIYGVQYWSITEPFGDATRAYAKNLLTNVNAGLLKSVLTPYFRNVRIHQ